MRIPNGVTAIAEDAFVGNYDQPIRITLPESMTTIPKSAFYFCSRMNKINIPNSVNYIETYAFSGCDGLTEVTIPDGVTNIDDLAFAWCDNLATITIPASVTYIGGLTFYRSDQITIVTSQGTYAEKYAKDMGIPYQYLDGTKPSFATVTNSPASESYPKVSEKPVSPVESTKLPQTTITAPPIPQQNISVPKVKRYRATVKKKKLILRWKKNANVSGYQIQISTKKGFGKAKKYSVEGKDSCQISKLKRRKSYFVRIRTYIDYQDKSRKTKRRYSKWTVIRKKTK